MRRPYSAFVALFVAAVLLLSVFDQSGVVAQERTRRPARATSQIDPPSLQLDAGAADDEALAPARARSSAPVRRARLSAMRSRRVETGGGETEELGALVVRSFQEQQTFATRMSKADLVGRAILALPEVDDEVLEFDDSYVIRRSTKIIVIDPARVARESQLFRGYLGERPRRAQRMTPAELDPDEQAALADFMANGVNALDPGDPIRQAAADGEEAVLNAIIAGKGTLIIEDTLIIPKRVGRDQGDDIRIPNIRGGILDLKAPEPVRAREIKGLGVDPKPVEPLKLQAKTIPPKPKRMPGPPTANASGKKQITVEFLAGITRSANFQWERKWTFPTGYFRFTLGAGYAFGYRVPIVAHATIEPTKAYIRDYADKKVIIGASGKAETVNGNGNYYKRAGLADNQVKGGRELLLEANVGYGYKLRAFWKTRAYRPYTASGISYSQNFRPPMSSNINCSKCDFVMSLDPKTTKMSINLTLLEGTAWIRFDGRTAGQLSVNLRTLVDNKRQKTYPLKNVETAAGVYPIKLTLNPVPLRAGTTSQVRPYGVRISDVSYKARLVITPQLKLGLRVGYKKLSLHFSTGWISLNGLRIDTGEMNLKRHTGTRSEYVWNGGRKTFVHLEKPAGDPNYVSGGKPTKPARAKPKRATPKRAPLRPARRVPTPSETDGDDEGG